MIHALLMFVAFWIIGYITSYLIGGKKKATEWKSENGNNPLDGYKESCRSFLKIFLTVIVVIIILVVVLLSMLFSY